MKYVLLLVLFAIVQKTMSQNAIYDFQMMTIDGREFDFDQLEGKPILLVNVASECGYTPQYEDLQQLHADFGDKVTVLGFPANNFGGQEPGTNESIALFCKKNYGVDFQMFEKIDVVGSNTHPLYQWLAERAGTAPSWNFCKYFVNADGAKVQFFPSSVNPLEEAITNQL
ncbi:MAG: glutathione peroxidase [Bacteroidota bacterium]